MCCNRTLFGCGCNGNGRGNGRGCGCNGNRNGCGCGCNGNGVGIGLPRVCGWEFVCRQASPCVRAAGQEVAALDNFRLFEESSGCGCG